MADALPLGRPDISAGFVLGRKLDSIPFSAYHVSIITVLALVGFIEGYDLVMTGSLLVLARAPLQLTNTDIRWLAVTRSRPRQVRREGRVLPVLGVGGDDVGVAEQRQGRPLAGARDPRDQVRAGLGSFATSSQAMPADSRYSFSNIAAGVSRPGVFDVLECAAGRAAGRPSRPSAFVRPSRGIFAARPARGRMGSAGGL